MPPQVFTKKEFNCPVCRTKFTVSYPNPRLYAASSRDELQRVTGYSWTAGIRTDVQPHHYAIVQCPKCMLADFREIMEKPGYNPKRKKIYSKLGYLKAEQRAILEKLKELAAGEQLTTEGALALHLSAVFVSLLPGNDEDIDHLKMGRLYLRLSQLFNELDISKGGGAGEAQNKPAKAGAAARLAAAVEKLEEQVQSVLEILEEIGEISEERTAELNLPEDKNPYAKMVHALEDEIERSLQRVAKLEETVVKDKTGSLVVKQKEPEDEKENKGEEENKPEAVLEWLASRWLQMPQDELGTLKLAVQALDYSFKHEEVTQDVQQSMAVGNLIMQLDWKLGNLDRALEYCSDLYKTGFRDKQSLQMTINQGKQDKSLTEAELKEMNRTLATVSHTLTKAADSRKELLGLIYERDKAKIASVLKAKNGAPLAEQMQALSAAGFPDDLVNWLKDRQVIKQDTKKKKWFG